MPKSCRAIGQALDQLHLKNLVDKKGSKNYVVRFEKGGFTWTAWIIFGNVLRLSNIAVRGVSTGAHVLRVAALVVYALAPHPVQAKTFHCGAGDVSCLIAAINEANANRQKKNTIRLEAGTYTLYPDGYR